MILFQGDAIQEMEAISENSVQLIFSSPPYNIGKEYESKRNLATYLNYYHGAIREFDRILTINGSICWQVGNYVEKGIVYPLDIEFLPMFRDAGFVLRNRIIWRFGHGLHCKNRLSGRYETILWMTRPDDYVFNLDPIRVPQKYPGKKHFKGAKKGELSGNPNGKNPSDIWDFLADEWSDLVWDEPNVKNNRAEKTSHPCQFPIALAERCVLALTNPKDVVLDPFCGVGSAVIAAVKNGRRGIGIDKSAEYLEIANDRLQSVFDGNLKYRPLGKKVHQP